MTTGRRGRPPSAGNAANAERVKQACAAATEALINEDEEAAAKILLEAAKKVVRPDSYRRGSAGFADLSVGALAVTRAFQWRGRPSSDDLIELLTLLMTHGTSTQRSDAAQNDAERARQRVAAGLLASAPDPAKVKAADVAKATGLDWKAANRLLTNPTVLEKAQELRDRPAQPVAAHKAAGRITRAAQRPKRIAKMKAVAANSLRASQLSNGNE